MERNMIFRLVPAPSVMAINKNFRFLADIVTNCYIYNFPILQWRKNNA